MEKPLKLYAALLKAQAEFKPIPHNARNPHFDSTFTTLDGVCDALYPILTKHGLLVTNPIVELPGGSYCMTTTLTHAESGEQIQTWYPLMVDRKTSQGFASAVTYARRYSLQSLVGATTHLDDDDANAAQGLSNTPQAPTRPSKPKEVRYAPGHTPTHDEPFQSALTADFDEGAFKPLPTRATLVEIQKLKNIKTQDMADIIKRCTGKASSKDLSPEEIKTVVRHIEQTR